MIEMTDGEIIRIADETRSAEPGANGYILPLSFARAILAAHAEKNTVHLVSDCVGGTVPGDGPRTFMVFDVESIGLHGEGFAVGYVVCNRRGEVLEEATLATDPTRASGEPKNLAWVMENIPAMPCDYFSPYEVREEFWARWMRWKALGAVLVADCCWPVEARFLAACVDDCKPTREWEGPYPLHDLASVLLALGRDPLATNERLPIELPAHHPLNDARQSARLLLEALAMNGKDTEGRDQIKEIQ
jgi:hypothetical protein